MSKSTTYKLPSELLATVDAGGGVADFFDPATNRNFVALEIKRLRPETEPLSQDELREMLHIAQRDYEAGKVSKRYTEELLDYAYRQMPSFSPAR